MRSYLKLTCLASRTIADTESGSLNVRFQAGAKVIWCWMIESVARNNILSASLQTRRPPSTLKQLFYHYQICLSERAAT